MQVHRYREPASFLKRAESFLLRAEAEHRLFLALAGTADARQALSGDDGYLATVENGTTVVACSVRTPPFGAVVSRRESGALPPLIDDLSLKYPTLPSALGPEPDITHFVNTWRDRFGNTVRTV